MSDKNSPKVSEKILSIPRNREPIPLQQPPPPWDAKYEIYYSTVELSSYSPFNSVLHMVHDVRWFVFEYTFTVVVNACLY